MDFINGNRPVAAVSGLAILQPMIIVPLSPSEITNNGCGGRRVLGAETHRICLRRQNNTVERPDFVFVTGTLPHFGQEGFPDTGRATSPHWMAMPVPMIEIADHGDPGSIGRPDGEVSAGNPLYFEKMCTQHVPQSKMRSFGQQMLVHIAEYGSESKRIFLFPLRSLGPDFQAISARVDF